MNRILRRPLRATALVTAVSGAVLLGTAAGSTAADTSGPMVRIDFSDDGAGGPASSGWLPVDTDLLTANSGSMLDGPGSSGRFPAWSPDQDGGRAVVRVRSTGAGDPLSPGRADFRVGVAFSLDDRSEGGDFDNGNNLVQRGLFHAAGQYKVQVEHGHVSCRVKGSVGDVLVISGADVTPSTWYSTMCERSGDTVTLTVRDRDTDATTVTTESGAIGSVDMGDGGVPLSVGGKLNATGGIVTGATDQMNGLVRHVVYDAG